MIAAQFLVAEFFAAVHAQVLVTAKQDAVAQGRFFRLAGMQLAGAGDDAVQFDAGLFTGQARGAAAYFQDG